jgi:probable HAF family extracellular repeat protein
MAAAPAIAQNWTLVDIGTLGGPGSYAAAVSDTGVVVGCADVAGGGAHAFIYANGVMRDLGTGSDSAGSSCALAVNGEGMAAGRSSTGELVIWSGAAVTHLGVQGDIGDIDARGVVVGAMKSGAGTAAFMFVDNAIVKIGDDGATGSAAAINAHQQIVGTSNGRAFLFENGALASLGTLGGATSTAKGINDAGRIVGMASNADGQPEPFVFDGSMQALTGPSYSGAIAINNRGQVIGSAEGTYGYLVDAGNYTRLDTIPAVVAKGWRHLEPKAINDGGWIVGTATTPSGDLRAFILIPQIKRAPVAAIARANRGP